MRSWLVLSLLGALVATGCNESPQGSPNAAANAPERSADLALQNSVKTVHPEQKTRQTMLETTGKVQFNEEGLVRVNAPVTGRVLEVLVRPGDIVDRGHRLLVLDSPDLGVAKADYAKAVADVERAEKALSLVRELYEVKAIPQKDVRETENDAKKAMAERERAASRLRTLGVTDDRFQEIAMRADATTTIVVTAPRSGIVVERNVTPGQVVAYGQSDTPLNLFVIADLSTMWVLADVYEPDVPKVRLGQQASVTLPCCPGDRYEGRVMYVSDSVDKESRTIKVRVVVPNTSRVLKAEMFVRVTILTGSVTALAIPQSAVHREGGEAYVILERGKDQYERHPVKLGAEVDGFVEVVTGISPTDRVVATGSILLKRTAK